MFTGKGGVGKTTSTAATALHHASTGASTRIEGAKLSDEDVEKLMRGLDIQKFPNRDKQEVKGYFEILENVFNSYESIKLSENTIKYLHKELLKYVQDKLAA